MAVTYFIDLEGVFPYDIVEVGVVRVTSTKEISFKKWLVKRLVCAKEDNFAARFCHCISESRQFKCQVDYQTLQEELTKFLNSHSKEEEATVAGYGDDITKSAFKMYFPSVDVTRHRFRQVDMPCWLDRDRMWIHGFLRAEKATMCQWHTLRYREQHRRNGTVSPSQRVRNKYGFHCALVDAFELAVVDGAIKVWDIMVIYDMWYVYGQQYIKTQ